MRKSYIRWIVVGLLVAFLAGCTSTRSGDSPLSLPETPSSPLSTPDVEVAVGEWPEGQIIYHADVADSALFQIYKVVDGQEPVRLSPGGNVDLGGRWSKGAEMIVFASYVDAARTNERIFTMASDGSNRVELPVDQPRLNWRPSLSPDGTQVLFISNRDGNFEIYKASLDGSFMANITSTPQINERDPDWSPDGSEILFVSDQGGGNGLYVMDVTGEGRRQLLDGSWFCSYPSWSPDGTKITFASRVDGNEDIYIINADGSDLTRVTKQALENTMPAWVGEDRLIFSAGDSSANIWNLFMVNVDGTGLVQLTDTGNSERYPQWHP